MRFGLRRLLRRIGCEYWSEYFCGYSYRGLRCMDLYEKVFTREQVMVPEDEYVEDEYARWYLLNSLVPWRVRRLPDVRRWWQYEDTVCIGQRQYVHWVRPPQLVVERVLPFRFEHGQLIRVYPAGEAAASGGEGAVPPGVHVAGGAAAGSGAVAPGVVGSGAAGAGGSAGA